MNHVDIPPAIYVGLPEIRIDCNILKVFDKICLDSVTKDLLVCCCHQLLVCTLFD